MSKFPPFRFVLLAFFFLFGTLTSAHAADIQELLLSGSKFVQDKKYEEAVREFRSAVTLDPDNAEANRLLGLSLAKSGKLDEAAVYTLKASQLKPAYSTYFILGMIQSNQGKYDGAVDSYNKALELNPKSYEAWHQLGKVHATTLAFDKAVEAYQKAADLNPKFPDAYQGLGSANYWSGNLGQALIQVDQLNKLGFAEKAKELERWIKDKESKKRKSEKKAGITPPAKKA